MVIESPLTRETTYSMQAVSALNRKLHQGRRFISLRLAPGFCSGLTPHLLFIAHSCLPEVNQMSLRTGNKMLQGDIEAEADPSYLVSQPSSRKPRPHGAQGSSTGPESPDSGDRNYHDAPSQRSISNKPDRNLPMDGRRHHRAQENQGIHLQQGYRPPEQSQNVPLERVESRSDHDDDHSSMTQSEHWEYPSGAPRRAATSDIERELFELGRRIEFLRQVQERDRLPRERASVMEDEELADRQREENWSPPTTDVRDFAPGSPNSHGE